MKLITTFKKSTKYATWITDEDITNWYYPIVRCSNCNHGFGKTIAENDFLYCPHCGARMVKAE